VSATIGSISGAGNILKAEAGSHKIADLVALHCGLARVKAMIRRDPEFDRFAESCHPRRREAEHYVNLPRDAERFSEDPCPLAHECVISAVDKDLAVLSSSSGTEQERLEALKYLGHWVGDVHQPLHVSFQDDRGGNQVGISGGLCSWELHAVWELHHRGRPRGRHTRGRRTPPRGGHRRQPGDMAGIAADRLGKRVLCDLDRSGGRILCHHQ
jgi:hypothetical protein